MLDSMNFNQLKMNWNKLLVARCSMEKWYPHLQRAQNEVSALCTFEHYVNAYRDEELYYWTHIPRWIYQDESDVENCLDIGCAYGTLALYMKDLFKSNIYTMDFVDKFLSKKLVEKNNFQSAVCNIELDDIPWNQLFDVILFTEVLEHLNFNAEPTLLKIRDALKPGGRLYLSTPDASEWGRVTQYYNNYKSMPLPSRGMPILDTHVYQFSIDEILGLVNECGFRVDKLDYAPGIVGRHINLKLIRD